MNLSTKLAAIASALFAAQVIAQEQDCIGSIELCDTSTFQWNMIPEADLVADLDTSNRGCLVANERLGIWLRFRIADDSPTDADLAFVIQPSSMMDLDFALWGPFMVPPDPDRKTYAHRRYHQ